MYEPEDLERYAREIEHRIEANGEQVTSIQVFPAKRGSVTCTVVLASSPVERHGSFSVSDLDEQT